jgi:formylglycine-generating enzyme required for sulfatase activity
VPGGYFQLGYDQGGPLQGSIRVPDEQPSDTPAVKVEAYSLDRYEVTVGRFREFVAQYDVWKNNAPHTGDGQDPNRPAPQRLPDGGVSLEVWDVGWNANPARVPPTSDELKHRIADPGSCGSLDSPAGARGDWTDLPGPNETHPMTCITWFEAMMFCIWDGGRLPTEAEWEFAAAGGGLQRAFPWSDPPSDTSSLDGRANFQLSSGARTSLVPVGSFPLGMGRYFQYDLAGNAYEWTMDGPQSIGAYDAEKIEPLDVSGDGYSRVVRGGSYEFPPAQARTSARNWVQITQRYNDLGLRCAR